MSNATTVLLGLRGATLVTCDRIDDEVQPHLVALHADIGGPDHVLKLGAVDLNRRPLPERATRVVKHGVSCLVHVLDELDASWIGVVVLRSHRFSFYMPANSGAGSRSRHRQRSRCSHV